MLSYFVKLIHTSKYHLAPLFRKDITNTNRNSITSKKPIIIFWVNDSLFTNIPNHNTTILQFLFHIIHEPAIPLINLNPYYP